MKEVFLVITILLIITLLIIGIREESLEKECFISGIA